MPMNGREVQTSARKLKRKFKRVTNLRHPLIVDHRNRDVNVVYLLDIGRRFPTNDPQTGARETIDAAIFWQNKVKHLRWNSVTRSEITTFLEYDGPEVNGQVIKEIANKLGRKFVRIKNLDNMLAVESGAGKRDPNTVYLLDPGHRFSSSGNGDYEEMDAVIYWQRRTMTLRFESITRARITKYLQMNDTNCECVVCFEDLPFRESMSCSKCSSTICIVCMLKMGLDNNNNSNIDRIMIGHRTGDWIIGHLCPECRQPCGYDIRNYWSRVMDQMDEFTDIQQTALLWAKENDHNSAEHVESWLRMHPSKDFAPGVTVMLHGLKKQEWNGRKAKVIEVGKVNDEGIVRVPVELIGRPSGAAKLKQTNMKVFNSVL